MVDETYPKSKFIYKCMVHFFWDVFCLNFSKVKIIIVLSYERCD